MNLRFFGRINKAVLVCNSSALTFRVACDCCHTHTKAWKNGETLLFTWLLQHKLFYDLGSVFNPVGLIFYYFTRF